ncbi:MarR family winged helix-turn-helix transcriptional regulator [Streptacidiphilus rugosus]|uniref:MarR family winged helix-turn-helix transcriptional regulator n=1 Tax=Streptacidiphilus rugosus TaxID=405783 RepID=UPI0005652201|nr:MarR family transcriptional regulator [Streptacidiphilus rugosus]
MTDVKGTGLPSTAVFQLGTLGAVAEARFARAVEELGLKPKHAGLMTALAAVAAESQQELAARLGVAPSLVVSLADQLEALGAVRRTRDPNDRRRQVLTLTETGHALLARCEALAHTLDDELLADLTPDQRAALAEALGIVAQGGRGPR